MSRRERVKRWFAGEPSTHSHPDDSSDQDEKSITPSSTPSSPITHAQDGDTVTAPFKHVNPFRAYQGNHKRSGSAHGDGSRWDRLNEFHTVFLIDDSASMVNDWADAMSLLGEVVPQCMACTQSDVSFFFTNRWTGAPSRFDEGWRPEWPVPSGHLDVRHITRAAARASGEPEEQSAEFVFEDLAPANGHAPDASTTIAKRLSQILRPYIEAYKEGLKAEGDARFKHMVQINMVVVTNGAGLADLETETLAIAEDLNDCGAPSAQVGIQFVQVGGDRECSDTLKNIDSDLILKHSRDMVDTVLYDQTRDPGMGHMTDDGLFKVLMGGVSRKVDMRRLEKGHFLGRS
ncbi:hypothetical protein BKA67DRAFT_655924 [Truncatella angustata]|uniref:VWFA domain-containing protein n=1 Tax=Truncatella angustata TaxID=152316 RepID=A0A9P8USR8_9PEZI|nr:uncharacterized protein BKA67DRAFT_655924 [Truncatella angustata]KAH6657674.1 hypothetical protein BKA67DRAFT_655924 [Truncatella angustata]KAH8197272.1 hypothetical protein TruAng_008555 [Truncatella angustata]